MTENVIDIPCEDRVPGRASCARSDPVSVFGCFFTQSSQNALTFVAMYKLSSRDPSSYMEPPRFDLYALVNWTNDKAVNPILPKKKDLVSLGSFDSDDVRFLRMHMNLVA